MPKILLGISAALAIAASVLGYLSGGKVVEQKEQLALTESKFTAATQEATKAKQAQKDAEDQLAPVKAQAQQALAELATTKTSLTSAQQDAKQAKQQLDELSGKSEAVANVFRELGIDPKDIGQAISTMKSSIDTEKAKGAELETKLKESEQLVVTLTQKNKDAEAKATELQGYKDTREKHMIAKSLEGQVLAVNQSWNFVVLSIGDGAGVVSNAEMIVMRGGETIAKVRVTSVEKSTSIADIIPGSAAHGVRVQPGDRVIYQGSQG